MAKVNFRQQKRQRELARKERQSQRLLRRGERPGDETSAVLTGPDQVVDGGSSAPPQSTEQT
jgi:hypothetical protein